MTKYLFLAILSIAAFSCQRQVDDTLPGTTSTTNCRFSRIVQGIHNGSADDTVYQFSYNATGQLTTMEQADNGLGPFVFNYDSQNRLIEQTLTEDASYFSRTFSYNNKGYLSEIVGWSPFDSIKTTYEYGADTVPTSSKHYLFDQSTQQWKVDYERSFTYQNGDLLKYTTNYSTGEQRETHFEYYDTIPNTLRPLALIHTFYIMFWMDEEGHLFSKHAVKRTYALNSTSDQAVIYRTYKLESGKITSSKLYYLWPNNANSLDTTMTLSWFYEYDCP